MLLDMRSLFDDNLDTFSVSWSEGCQELFSPCLFCV